MLSCITEEFDRTRIEYEEEKSGEIYSFFLERR